MLPIALVIPIKSRPRRGNPYRESRVFYRVSRYEITNLDGELTSAIAKQPHYDSALQRCYLRAPLHLQLAIIKNNCMVLLLVRPLTMDIDYGVPVNSVHN